MKRPALPIAIALFIVSIIGIYISIQTSQAPAFIPFTTLLLMMLYVFTGSTVVKIGGHTWSAATSAILIFGFYFLQRDTIPNPGVTDMLIDTGVKFGLCIAVSLAAVVTGHYLRENFVKEMQIM